MFPHEEPKIHANTTIVASFGRKLKHKISTTTLGPPPPSPAKLDKPATVAIRMQPTMCLSENIAYKPGSTHAPN